MTEEEVEAHLNGLSTDQRIEYLERISKKQGLLSVEAKRNVGDY